MKKMLESLDRDITENYLPLWIPLSTIIIFGIIIFFFLLPLLEQIESRRIPPSKYRYHQYTISSMSFAALDSYASNCTNTFKISVEKNTNGTFMIDMSCYLVIDPKIEAFHLNFFWYSIYTLPPTFLFVVMILIFLFCLFGLLPYSIKSSIEKWRKPKMESISYI